MSTDNRIKILNMLADGKVSAQEAERLLKAMDDDSDTKDSENVKKADSKSPSPRYLYISVQPKEGSQGKQERVNLRIPLNLIRAGLKLQAIIPAQIQGAISEQLQKKGISLDLSELSTDNSEEFIEAVAELFVDIETENEHVKIYSE